jgi:integrase
MAGAVKQTNLRSRTGRARLKRGVSHWHTLVTGRAHLGWERKGTKAGRWVLRRYVDRLYKHAALGLADDVVEADGETVLAFEQAEAAARALLDRPAARAHRLTVRQAMANYVAFKESQGQPTSDLRYRSDAHILPSLGNLVVAELTATRLRKWLAALAAMPSMKRSRRGGEQSYAAEPSTDEDIRRRRASANRVLSMLKASLNFAHDEGHVADRSAWDRKLKPFREVEVARVRFLSVAEAQRLINAADPEFRPLVEAGLQSGARYGELIRLEVADFNRDAGTVAVRRSKSGKARHVVLTEEGAAFFAQVCAGRAGSELMFRRADGSAWEKSAQARPMAEAVKRAKIVPAINFHGLRHTWASLAVMAGVPLLVVAKNLGHTDSRMVERHYSHLAPSFVADAIRAGAPRFGTVTAGRVVPIR